MSQQLLSHDQRTQERRPGLAVVIRPGMAAMAKRDEVARRDIRLVIVDVMHRQAARSGRDAAKAASVAVSLANRLAEFLRPLLRIRRIPAALMRQLTQLTSVNDAAALPTARLAVEKSTRLLAGSSLQHDAASSAVAIRSDEPRATLCGGKLATTRHATRLLPREVGRVLSFLLEEGLSADRTIFHAAKYSAAIA